MSYQGLTFALMIGFAIGTAIYCYFTNENPNEGYQYANYNTVPYSSPSDTSSNPSKKRRRNSNIPQNCTICLDQIKSINSKTISCGHVFHNHCITVWFNTSKTCPICRKQQL